MHELTANHPLLTIATTAVALACLLTYSLSRCNRDTIKPRSCEHPARSGLLLVIRRVLARGRHGISDRCLDGGRTDGRHVSNWLTRRHGSSTPSSRSHGFLLPMLMALDVESGLSECVTGRRPVTWIESADGICYHRYTRRVVAYVSGKSDVRSSRRKRTSKLQCSSLDIPDRIAIVAELITWCPIKPNGNRTSQIPLYAWHVSWQSL